MASPQQVIALVSVLERVEVTQEVLLTCMTHALSTENEEIMGLLLGDVKEIAPGRCISRIWMAYPQIRTDRRKDRVETSPEQMARCSAHADRLSRETGQHIRVVGWYHSHPHITVLPSHIDVRTQAMYQMLDPGFVGLIFSTFNSDSNGSKAGMLQVTAFQSVPASSAAAARAASGGHMDRELMSYSSDALAGLDTPTKEAIRASQEAMHGAGGHEGNQMARREVPLTIIPASSPSERSLYDMVIVHKIMAVEERDAYARATGIPRSSRRSASPSPASTPTVSTPTVASTQQASGASTPTASTNQPDQNPNPSGETEQKPSTGNEQKLESRSGSLKAVTNGTSGNPASQASALVKLHAANRYQQGLVELMSTLVAASLTGMTALHSQYAMQADQLRKHNAMLKDMIRERKHRRVPSGQQIDLLSGGSPTSSLAGEPTISFRQPISPEFRVSRRQSSSSTPSTPFLRPIPSITSPSRPPSSSGGSRLAGSGSLGNQSRSNSQEERFLRQSSPSLVGLSTTSTSSVQQRDMPPLYNQSQAARSSSGGKRISSSQSSQPPSQPPSMKSVMQVQNGAAIRPTQSESQPIVAPVHTTAAPVQTAAVPVQPPRPIPFHPEIEVLEDDAPDPRANALAKQNSESFNFKQDRSTPVSAPSTFNASQFGGLTYSGSLPMVSGSNSVLASPTSSRARSPRQAAYQPPPETTNLLNSGPQAPHHRRQASHGSVVAQQPMTATSMARNQQQNPLFIPDDQLKTIMAGLEPEAGTASSSSTAVHQRPF